MAIDFTTNPGGLFRRLGRIGGALNHLHTFLGSGDLSAGGVRSVGVVTDNIADQFEASRQDLDTGLYAARDAMRGSHSEWQSYLQSLAQATVIAMAHDDAPLPAKTTEEAIKEVIKQMSTGAQSIPQPTVSTSVSAASGNVGNGKLVASIVNPKDGKQLDYVFAEAIRVTCISDGQGDGTAAQETFQFQGAAAQSDTLFWDWPDGSGATVTLNVCDPAQDNDGNNLLQNGACLTFTNSNIQDNWIVDVGTRGTTILQASGSNAYRGNYAISFAGNGAELTSVYQPFNTTPSTTLGAGGTSAELEPLTTYAVSCWVKTSATPAAGVLSLALTDTAGTILNDANGAANNVTQNLTSVGTTWVHVSGFFRTPAALPTGGYRLRVRLSTALENGKTVYIDDIALTPATQLYAGGPYVAMFPGATNFVLNDKFTLTVSNNYGSKWALLLERLFGLRDLGLVIPSSGAPTISDSWID